MMTSVAFAVGWREAHLAAASASAELRDRYALAPVDAGRSLTLQVPTIHQLSLGWTDERGPVSMFDAFAKGIAQS